LHFRGNDGAKASQLKMNKAGIVESNSRGVSGIRGSGHRQ